MPVAVSDDVIANDHLPQGSLGILDTKALTAPDIVLVMAKMALLGDEAIHIDGGYKLLLVAQEVLARALGRARIVYKPVRDIFICL